MVIFNLLIIYFIIALFVFLHFKNFWLIDKYDLILISIFWLPMIIWYFLYGK